MSRRAAAALAAAALLLCGCGGSSGSPAPPPTLAASAVPYLPSSVSRLTIVFLARDAGSPGLVFKLRAWGYRSGGRRYFQGESRRLQVVDSRTLRFAGAAGAATYVRFMRGHLEPFLGSFAAVSPLPGGFLARGQECQCHLANPSFLALRARGAVVTWLEINGPGATRRLALELLRRAR